MQTTIKVSEETLHRLRVLKAQQRVKTYDALINDLLEKAVKNG